MGPSLEQPLSAPSKKVLVDNLADTEEIVEKIDEKNEFFEPDLVEITKYPDVSEIRWPAKTIEAFRRHYNELPADVTFDNLENRLVKTVRFISTEHDLYCIKCLGMRALKKHGKVNTSYQFECRNHKISAKQILENLPDEFIIELIPKEPAVYFNLMLKWLSKDHLSPELVKLTTERNAVKRFSQTQEDETNVCTSLIKCRNVENELISESLGLKARISSLEESVNKLVLQINALAEANSSLKMENKALMEENQMLKRHLSTPATPATPVSPTATKVNHSTYAGIASINRPMNATLKFYTKAGSLAPKDIIEPIVKQVPENPNKDTNADSYSPLKFVYFVGCHRKTASTYRNMLPKIGIDAHWARDITFLAEDLVQITTFESKAELLIKAMESISPKVKHLPDFNPCFGESYAKYGQYTDESAKKAYFTLMQKNAERLKKDAKLVPSLKRVASFFDKVVEVKDTKYQSPSRTPTIFCLGNFFKFDKAEITGEPMDSVEMTSQVDTPKDESMQVDESTTRPENEN